MEEEAGRSEKQQEVAERKPVEEEAGTSTATPEKGCFEFEVFISFRGEDTRNGFTSHLYKELDTRGITAFIDSENLNKGETISVLFERIERSKIFVPVFSENYADSKWCLKEIDKMVEIYKSEGKRRPIIPIFYHVDPSDVRHCKGSFGKAFENLQEDKELGEEINEWKTALKAAGKISGYHLSKDERTTEAEIITRIGFTMGGIGKTTLAMALYNGLFRRFEVCCFLPDIRENGGKHGLPNLQMKLMGSKVEKDMSLIDAVEKGISLMKQRLRSKKVLLVLDDVNDKDQLEALTGERGEKEKFFGAGSKIIVTTRDERVLLQHGLQKRDIYFPKGLNRKDSLKLFCHHVFVSDQPLLGFEELSQEVVKVAQGLPLALKVFGSLFYGLKEKQEWEEQLKKLKSDQHDKVHERLKISYGGLDGYEQRVFLDIACFFIGTMIKYPVYMWDDCSPTLALKALQHKSLVKINKNDEFEMHDQIRDMGRMLVKKEGKFDPLKYCRPWSRDQLLEVLNDAEVSLQNDYVQGIDFAKVRNEKEERSWKVKCRMPRLRMITGANGNHRFEDIPSNIRWLDWKCCPHQTLTFLNNCLRENLRILDLSNGKFKDFGDIGLPSMAFPKLKVLDLSRCSHLTRIPDFTHFPSLIKLVLDECCSLTKMDESIRHLKKLVELSMVRCEKLTELPIGLCKLPKLESLVLSGCEQILVLPTQIGDLSSLKYLGLSGTSISAVPDSIGSLQSLEKLDLTHCSSLEKIPDSICGLKRLADLSLPDCELLERLPNSIGMRTLEIDDHNIFKKGRIEKKSLIHWEI